MASAISDSELIRMLKELDFQPGPITDTTRHIYLKKLESLCKQKSKVANKRLSAIQAIEKSSDPSPRRSPRRTIDPGPSQNQENGRMTPTKEENKRETVPKQSTPKPSKIMEEEEDGTDDDYNEFIKRTRTPRRRVTEAATGSGKKGKASKTRRTLATAPTTRLANYSSPESSGDDDVNRDKISSSISSVHELGAKVTSPRLRASTNLISNVPLVRPPIRKSVRIMKSKLPDLSNFSDSETDVGTQSTVDRLLQLRPGSNANKNLGESENEEANFYLSTSQLSSYSTYNWISLALVVFVVTFFVSIFSYYFYSRLNFSLFGLNDGRANIQELSLDIGSQLNVPICDRNSKGFCFSDEVDARISLIILNGMKKFVDRKIFTYLCGEGTSRQHHVFEYPVKDLTRFIENTLGSKLKEMVAEKDPEKILGNHVVKYLLDTLSLIEINPQLKLNPIRDVYEDFTHLKVDPDKYEINLPIKCRFYLLFINSLPQIAISVLIILISFGTYKYAHHRKRMAQEEEELVEELIEKSLELLQSPDEPGSMPVIHIRDTLLTPIERNMPKYKKAWSRVVAAIESNESRVKVELENIDGEDFKTWRWIAMASLSPSNSNPNLKKIMKTGSMEWQGKAFEGSDSDKMDKNDAADKDLRISYIASKCTPTKSTFREKTMIGSPALIGSTFVAPTRFLKVRNMFDHEAVGVDLAGKVRERIMDAILEKCTSQSSGGHHGITHINVDISKPDEGLVYIKTDSIDSASSAFHALHGWWCERKLVSVRFLKEERYYQRFPEAQMLNVPLSLD